MLRLLRINVKKNIKQTKIQKKHLRQKSSNSSA